MTSTETTAPAPAAPRTPVAPLRWFHYCPAPRCSHGDVTTDRNPVPGPSRCTLHGLAITTEPLTVDRNPEHVCDAECTGARQGRCECSCGGVNHGVQRMTVEVGARARGAAAYSADQDAWLARGDTRPVGFRGLPQVDDDEPW